MIQQPSSTDKLNTPDHALSHRVFANDDSAPAKKVVVDSDGNSYIGDYEGGNYSKIKSDGKIHFAGDGRPTKLYPIHSTLCEPAHHNPLKITSLTVADGIATSGLDTPTGNSRRIEVIGIDGGIHVKGRMKATYTQKDTTHESCIIKVKLHTTNAVWDQASEWRLTLNILSGPITGKFTCFIPPFSMMEYDELTGYITKEGATYLFQTQSCGFDKSLAGPSAASENFTGDIVAGSDIVIGVADTSRFYEGNQVFISDSANSEWARIKSIISNTSITVDTLANPYTVSNGAKIEIFDYTRTPSICPTQRGMLKKYVFKANENSGVVFQFAIPQEIDPDADIDIVLQYLSSEGNPSALITKWRTQYVIKQLGENIPDSIQYGTLVAADVTPPVVIGNTVSTICTIPAATHSGKHILAVKINRLGADSGDTYLENISLIAFIISIRTKRLGYEA